MAWQVINLSLSLHLSSSEEGKIQRGKKRRRKRREGEREGGLGNWIKPYASSLES